MCVLLCPKHPTETTKREEASVAQSSEIFQAVMMVDKGEFTVSGAGGRGSLCLEI